MADKEVINHFQALNLGDFEELGFQGEMVNGQFIFQIPIEQIDAHPHLAWEDPATLLAERGTLEYPSECPNHHLAKNTLPKWRRNHIKRRRNRFNQRFIRHWGDKPVIIQDPNGTAPPNSIEIGVPMIWLGTRLSQD